MKYLIFPLFIALFFAACSQEDEQTKENSGIKIVKKVKTTAHKKEALVCLDEDDKITCKLLSKRVNSARDVVFQWQSPNKKDDRNREMVLPANHASIFDSRLKKGRDKGLWSVKVDLDGEEVATTFTIR